MTAIESLAVSLAPLGELRRDERLARHTTFGVGGPADLFLTVRSAEALAAATNAAYEADVPRFVLGSGSNILVADAGIRGLVLDNRARAESAISDLKGVLKGDDKDVIEKKAAALAEASAAIAQQAYSAQQGAPGGASNQSNVSGGCPKLDANWINRWWARSSSRFGTP